MSMPSFPPCGANMTKDEALTMIVASIAMEELALSHIVNAEGEKLQYILGTLPGGSKTCASAQEVLEVNQSVNKLLDTVMQSQMLLKGKLERALESGRDEPPPIPGPHCPCRPAHRPPQGEPCCKKSAILLTEQCAGGCWENGTLLYWKCQAQTGSSIRWDAKSPALVSLDPAKAYELQYTANVRELCTQGDAGAVFVRLTPHDALSGAMPFYFSTKCLECSPLTLHFSAVLFPKVCPPPYADLSLRLEHKGGLLVDQASLSIVEI